MPDLLQIVFYLLALVISLSIHEFAHAWSACELGDNGPRDDGRLTLNPIAHLDPMGTVMLLFMVFAGWGIGWGKPVQVNPYRLRPNPRLGLGLTSVAGPFSNLVLAALAAIPLRLNWPLPGLVSTFFLVMVIVNVSLALFNLIPLPPLDGFGALQGLLATFRTRWAREWGLKLDQLAPYGPVLLLGLLAVGWFLPFSPIGWLLSGPLESILHLLLGW